MADYNSGFGSLGGGGFGGLGSTLSNLSQNPLILASLQMMGNNTPQIGRIPNTMEGVPATMMAANQQQNNLRELALKRAEREAEIARKQAEIDANSGALSDVLTQMYPDMPREQIQSLSRHEPAVTLYQGWQKQLRQADEQRRYHGPGEEEHENEPDDPIQQPMSQQPLPQQQAPPQQPQQQPVPQQQAPQQPQRPMRQTEVGPEQEGAAPNPVALQKALSDTTQQFDEFGRANVHGTVEQTAKALAAKGNQTQAAAFVDAARRAGLSTDSKLTREMMSDPAVIMPLARAAGVGVNVPDNQWTQAHAAAIAMSNQRKAADAQKAQQRTPQQAAPAQAPPAEQAQAAAAAPEQAPVGPATRKALIAQEKRKLADMKKDHNRRSAFLSSSENVGLRKDAELRIQNLQKKIGDTEERIAGMERADAAGIPLDVDEKTVREEKGKKYVAQEGLQQSRRASSNVVIQDLDEAVKLVKKNPEWTTGFPGEILQQWPGKTEAGKVKSLLASVKPNIGLDKIQEMRAQGTTLGQVTLGEHELVQAVYGDMTRSKGPEQFLRNAARLRWLYNDMMTDGVIAKGGTMPTFRAEGGVIFRSGPVNPKTGKPDDWFKAD